MNPMDYRVSRRQIDRRGEEGSPYDHLYVNKTTPSTVTSDCRTPRPRYRVDLSRVPSTGGFTGYLKSTLLFKELSNAKLFLLDPHRSLQLVSVSLFLLKIPRSIFGCFKRLEIGFIKSNSESLYRCTKIKTPFITKKGEN